METELYKDNGILVTNARFVTAGQTISINGITSVTTKKLPLGGPEKIGLVFGLILLVAAKGVLVKVIGLLLLAYGLWGIVQPTYALLLMSAAREQRVIADRNKARVLAVAEAVNEALIHRS